MNEQKTNPLGTEKISNLLLRFAIPSIIAMVVSALYNMVDQFFIGRSVGMLGNAATNDAFFTWYDPLYHNKIIFKTNDDLIWRNI